MCFLKILWKSIIVKCLLLCKVSWPLWVTTHMIMITISNTCVLFGDTTLGAVGPPVISVMQTLEGLFVDFDIFSVNELYIIFWCERFFEIILIDFLSQQYIHPQCFFCHWSIVIREWQIFSFAGQSIFKSHFRPEEVKCFPHKNSRESINTISSSLSLITL